jgi:TRAP-type uncharacterized transport system fused permease subunit
VGAPAHPLRLPLIPHLRELRAQGQEPAFKGFLYLCLAVALAGCAYVYLNIEELEMSQGFPSRAALVVGVCLILCTSLGTY